MLPVGMGVLMGFGPVGMLLFLVDFEFIQTLSDGLIVFIPTMLRGFGFFSRYLHTKFPSWVLGFRRLYSFARQRFES